MIKPALALSLPFAAIFALLSPAEAAILYRSNEGWSVEGDASTVVEASAVDQMKKAEGLEAGGDTTGALTAYRLLVKKYGTSVLAPKAQRKIGQLLERSGHHDPAFEADEVYLTKYAKGEDFDEVVESMYRIAKMFLDGEKKKVLGVPLAPSMMRAESMFEAIVKRAPFSKWAPLAQFNVGLAREKQGKVPEAIQAYQEVVSKYPTDPIADDALYQVGYVRLRDYREGSNDRASATKAREAFEDFINRYPNSEKVAQAREDLKTLETGQTKNALEIAKYYDRMRKYKAAVIYYNDIIKQEPDSPDAEFAKKRVALLKDQVGEDALSSGPDRAETGDRAVARRKLQAKVDTASRPDYVGPPVVIAEQKAPEQKIETAPSRPQLRTSPGSFGPATEPPLPSAGGEPGAPDPSAPLPGDPGAPGAGQPAPEPLSLQPDTGLPTPPK